MTTLIAVYNSDGCVGRCDARCYLAKTPECDCICGGKNHGAGVARAIYNVGTMVGLTPDDLARFAAQHELNARDLVAVNRLECTSARKALREARRDLKRYAGPEPELDFRS